MKNVKVNKPTLLTDGCIYTWGQVNDASCCRYSSISKSAKPVNVRFKTPTRGEISPIVVGYTGPKVFGEGGGKVKSMAKIAVVVR